MNLSNLQNIGGWVSGSVGRWASKRTFRSHLLTLPLTHLLVCASAPAAQQITAYLTITNTAQHSNSLTFNSTDLRYAVTNVTNNATQWPVTNTAASTATNLLVHLAGFPPL